MSALNTTSSEQVDSRTVAPPVPPMSEPPSLGIISEMASQVAMDRPVDRRNQAVDDRRRPRTTAPKNEDSRRAMTSTIGSRRKR